MINYNNGLIYYIRMNGSDKYLYIGSTTNIKTRSYVHKHRVSNKTSEYYDDELYSIIRNNGGWNNWKMGILSVYACNKRDELQAYERQLIEELHPNLNSSLPSTHNLKYKQL